MRLRLALALVMRVDIVAAMLIAATSLTAATTLVTIAVLAIALDVGAFAVSQMLAIRRHHSSKPARFFVRIEEWRKYATYCASDTFERID